MLEEEIKRNYIKMKIKTREAEKGDFSLLLQLQMW